LNDGTGKFSDATARLPQLLDRTMALQLGDVDGDRDLDLVLGNDTDPFDRFGQTRLYLNDGNGNFSEATDRLPIDDDRTRGMALIDVDEDGDLDLVLGNEPKTNGSGTETKLYLNDGLGKFTEAPHHRRIDHDTHWTSALVAGDVDRDQDLDLVLLGDGVPARVYLNLHRHNDVVGLKLVGKNYGFAIRATLGYGTADQLAVPFLSPLEQRPPLDVRPHGFIGLDLQFAIYLGVYVVPAAAGQVTTTFSVPNDVNLHGVDFFYQTVILHTLDVGSWRWTNLLRERSIKL
jgi:hypothetical protein